MSLGGHERCAVCGAAAEDLNAVPGAGPVCETCLLGGRFLDSTGAPRMVQAARQLLDIIPGVRPRIEPLLNEAIRLVDKRLPDSARKLLVDKAQDLLQAGQPLLAAFLLQAGLGLHGNSTAVYAGLGDAARAMDCAREACQHYKTAGWLAMQTGDRGVVERTLAGLEQIAPEDPWLAKARDWLGGILRDTEPLCGFCGQPASAVGPLIQGPQAAICRTCLQRLADESKP